MNKLTNSLGIAVVLTLASCSGSTISNLGNIQARIDTLNDCFPGMFERFEVLLDVIETWRLNDGTMAADPAGLQWTERTDGSLQVDYVVGGNLPDLDMQITFFNESGVPQDLDLTGASTLSEALDLAATALATAGAPRPFITADWSLREMGAVIAGAGSVTAIIGGTGSQNQLESLFTSLGSSTANGGPPNGSDATISTANGDCVTRIDVPDLQVDTAPSQRYPMGTVTFNITGPAMVGTTATVTFDGSNMAGISVANVPSSFTFNLDTLSIN